MNYIVTGGCGFIGHHLVKRLVLEDHRVAVIDNLSTGKSDNLVEGAEFHQWDLTTLSGSKKYWAPFSRVVKDWGHVDAIFHLAAIPNVQLSILMPIATNLNNITATLHVLDSAVKLGIPRVIFSSSCSVYGDQPGGKFVETMHPNPLSPYALQKYTGEIYCRQYHQIHGLKTISLRYFNVYGPRQNAEGSYAALIPTCYRSLVHNTPFIIHGDGEQTRDFTYVDDVVAANVLAAKTDVGFGEVFNIGGGSPTSVNQIVRLVSEAVGKPDYEPMHGPPVVETRHAAADISKAMKTLGWFPEVTIDSGLEKALA